MTEKRTVELNFLCQLSLWAIWAALVAIGFHLGEISDAIERHSSFAICIEAAKAGVESPSCERLAHRQQERPE